MEVDSGLLVRVDFFRIEKCPEVASKLDDLYEQNQTIRDQTIEFGTNTITVSAEMYCGHFEMDNADIFEETVAFIVECSNIERICQVITVGWLSNEAIESIGDEPVVQSRAIQGNWRDKLDSITNDYPAGLLTDDGPYPGFLILQSEEEILPLETDLETFRRELADLDGYGLQPFETLTTVDEAFLIAKEWNPEREGFLPLLSQAKPDKTHSTPDECESWFHFSFRRLKMLTTPLLIDHWLRSRKKSIELIDDQSHGFTIPEMDETQKPADVRDTESELESLRDQWVKTFTATSDEVTEMKDLLAIYDTDIETVRFEQAFPEGEKGYILTWKTALNSRVLELENSLERVQTKLEMIAGIVRDRLQSTATRSNLDLQTTVQRLTWLLLGLGVLQFLVSARNTSPVSGIARVVETSLRITPNFSLVTLLFGFLFIGYVLGRERS